MKALFSFVAVLVTLLSSVAFAVPDFISPTAPTMSDEQIARGLALVKQTQQETLLAKTVGITPAQISTASKGSKRYVSTGLSALRTLYVNPVKGNDANIGSTTKPFKTLSKVISLAKAGDVVQLSAGRYPVSETLKVRPGVRIQGSGINKTVVFAANSLGTIFDFNCNNFRACGVDARNALTKLTLDGQNVTKLGVFSWNGTRHVYSQIFYRNFNESGIRINGSGAEVSDSLFLNAAGRDVNRPRDWWTGALYFENLKDSYIHHNVIVENTGGGIKKSVGGAQRRLQIFNNKVVLTGSDTIPTNNSSSMEIWDLQDNNKIHHNSLNAWVSLVQQWQRNSATPVATKGNLYFYQNTLIPTPGVTDCCSAMEIALQGAEFTQNFFSGWKYRTFWMEGWSSPNNYMTGYLLFDSNVILDEKASSGIAGIGPGGTSVKDIKFNRNTFVNTAHGISIGLKPGNTVDGVQVTNNLFKNGTAAVIAWGKADQYKDLVVRGNSYQAMRSANVISGNANPKITE